MRLSFFNVKMLYEPLTVMLSQYDFLNRSLNIDKAHMAVHLHGQLHFDVKNH